MKNTLRTLWVVLLALGLGFAVQAQQQVNNFRVLTNLHVGGTTTLGGPVSVGGVTLATNELSYLDGVTGNIQAQIDAVDTSGYSPTTRATAAVFFGDSVVAGSSATTTANTWWRLVSDHYGWTYTNLAFGGAVVTDLNWESQPGYSVTNYYNNVLYTTPTATATNLTVFAKVGINDGADFPTTSGSHAAFLTHYYQSWLAFAAYWATPGKTLATAATASGTWSAWTNYFAASSGRQSSTSGATLTFTTQGDAIYVAFPVSLTNTTSFGKFWVSIDGTAVELVDPNGVGFGNRNQYGTPSGSIPYSATNAFWAKRYAGYGQRRHTVLITATNNASLPTVINWVAGSQQPIGPNSGPSVFLLENLNRAADATRDATYSALRAQVNQVTSQLGGDGLQVAIIRPNSVYDSANSGDGIHPNDAGMVQVAQAVRQAVDRFRGLAITAGQGSSGSGLSAAGSGLSESSGTVSLGGTLTADATIAGGSYGLSVSRTSANNPAIKATAGASTYGVQIDADSSFPLVVTSSGTPVSYWRKTLGSIGSPSAVTSGTVIWDHRLMAYDGVFYYTGVSLYATAEENWTASAHGANFGIYTTPNGTTTPVLSTLFNASGNVTMAYDLTVDDVIATTLSASGTAAGQATLTRYVSSASGGNLYLRKARGTSGSPTSLLASDTIFNINFTPYAGSGFINGATIEGFAGENLSGSAAGTGMRFYTTPNGTTSQTVALVLNPSGSASFGSGVSATTLTASGLTSGRIPLVSTSGLLIDNSAFTYTSNTHLNVPTLLASTGVDVGNADTTLSRQSAGVVALESVPVIDAAVGTLAYSGTTVNITAGKGVAQEDTLTCTNSFSLTFSSLNNKDAGYVTIWPATTNCTITLPSYAFGLGSRTLTINGGTGNTNYSVLTWFNTVVGGTNRVSVNIGNYF